MGWRVVIDFDGTITRGDLSNAILTRFASTSWRSIEDEWQAGHIGSRDCLARQVALIRAGGDELDAFVAAQPVDPFFVAFIADCRRRSIPVTIASDGFDRVIGAVLSRIGLGSLDVFANRLVPIGDRRWQLAFPHARDDCRARSGTCKCRVTRSDAGGCPETILIGDGRSDLCAAGIADYVFAKNNLLVLCRQHGIAHRPFETFEDAGRLLADVVDDGPVARSSGGIEETTNA